MAEPSDLASVGADIEPDVLAQIRNVHDEIGFSCAAHDEGQNCCLDFLVGTAE